MKTLAIFIHGLATPIGVGSMSGLPDLFAKKGIECEEYSYGFLWLGGAIERNHDLSIQLAQKVDDSYASGYDKVIVVGHSNGCSLINMASNYWKRCSLAILLHGAVPRDELPKKTRNTQIYFCPEDIVISMLHNRLLYPFKCLREKTGWGDIGVKGYTGDKPNYQNFLVQRDGLSRWRAHSAVFHKIHKYGPQIVDNAVASLDVV